MSQKQLSEISGIQQAEISRIERGRANPTLATLERLTGPLGVRFSVA
ncbi:helix-turn-helix transcriptional regulator [Corynebacterium testudinoris]|nr:helix-turn-helix transcriptional regulator [Corynebacterium testudinoris]